MNKRVWPLLAVWLLAVSCWNNADKKTQAASDQIRQNLIDNGTPEQMMKQCGIDTTKQMFIEDPLAAKEFDVSHESKFMLQELPWYDVQCIYGNYGTWFWTWKNLQTGRLWLFKFTVTQWDGNKRIVIIEELGYITWRNKEWENALDWQYENWLSIWESENTESNLNTEINNRTEQDIAAKRGVNLENYTVTQKPTHINWVGVPQLSYQSWIITKKDQWYTIKENGDFVVLEKNGELFVMLINKSVTHEWESSWITFQHATITELKTK